MKQMALVKIRLVVTVAILVSATALGCHFESRDPPTFHTLQVPMDDVLKQSAITQNVTLPVGHTLTVKLGSNFTTPYRWTPNAKIGDSTVVQQTGHDFVKPTADYLGAPGTEVWTFTALKAGTTTISVTYASFMGKDPKPVCTYTANATVQ
jgi:inhibitor of cysteine peptidase